MSKRGALSILLLVIVLAVALRSYQLTARSLWFDEAFSWRLIQFPMAEMIARAAADVHPPLYYILLKGWSVVFGTSLLSLRSFSVTAAAAAIAAAYLFTSSAARTRWPGILAALLIALSGWQIQFGAEARMYTLGATLALLSSWALLRAMRQEPQSMRWWLAYAGLAGAFAYIHYYAFFTIAAHAVFVIGYLITVTGGRVMEILNTRRFWYALGAAASATALYLPWFPTLIRQNSQVQASYWIPTIGGWSIPDTFYRMLIPTSGIPAHSGFLWILVALLPMLVTMGVVAILLIHRSRQATTADAQWLAGLLCVVPFLLSISISFISQSLYQDRFFMFTHLFILIAGAIVLARIPWRGLQTAIVAAVLIGFAAAAVNYWRELDITSKPGVQAAAKYMYEVSAADPATNRMNAPVIVSSPFVYFAVLHYATEHYHVAQPPRLYSASGELGHFAGGPILKSDDVVDRTIFDTASSTLWVVDTTGFGGSKLDVPPPWAATETIVYPEVFAHQGEVSVTRYSK